MNYDNGPCWLCIEKSCKNCPCAVAEAYENTYLDAQWMQKLSWNKDDCDKFVERLWKENTDIAWTENERGELVLDQNWRGFPLAVSHRMIGSVGWMSSIVRVSVGFMRT